MARVAEYDGMLFEVASFASELFTGRDVVVLRRYFGNPNDFINLGGSYAGVTNWVVSTEEFKEMFRWVNA